MSMHPHAPPAEPECHGILASTILTYGVPGAAMLNTELLRCVLELRARHPGVIKTNIGGWHSDITLQLHDAPCIKLFLNSARYALTQLALRMFDVPDSHVDANAWRIEMWANVNNSGDANAAHDHFATGTLLSAFYYVHSGEFDAGGRTVFVADGPVPRYAQCPVKGRAVEHVVTPTNGVLVAFPSWLRHRVEPYRGGGARVTLALNAGHPALPVRRVGDRPLPLRLARLLRRRVPLQDRLLE